MSKISLNDFKAQQTMVDRQRRRATWASLVVAVLVMVLLMLILALVLLPSLVRENDMIVSYAAPSTQEDKIENKKVQQVMKKPSAPSSSSAKVIVSNVASPTAIPVPEIDAEVPTLELVSWAAT